MRGNLGARLLGDPFSTAAGTPGRSSSANARANPQLPSDDRPAKVTPAGPRHDRG